MLYFSTWHFLAVYNICSFTVVCNICSYMMLENPPKYYCVLFCFPFLLALQENDKIEPFEEDDPFGSTYAGKKIFIQVYSVVFFKSILKGKQVFLIITV